MDSAQLMNRYTMDYLLEFRQRAVYVLFIYGVLFITCFLGANYLYDWLVTPLVAILPEQSSLIAINITASVLTPFHLASNLAFLLSAPVIIIQCWRFISPALYLNEKRIFRLISITSPVLFFLGMIFCYYIILPFMFSFFLHALPHTVSIQPDITHTLDFILSMLYIFGFCFQIPLLLMVLVQTQILCLEKLHIIRAYYIVSAFIIGMILTPPDVFSQLLVAIPLCLLYEIGVLGVRIFSIKN